MTGVQTCALPIFPIASGNPVYGFVQYEALRAMDLRACEDEGAIEAMGALDDNTLARVMAYVLVVLGVKGL